MGEARRRGTFAERAKIALKRNKDKLVSVLGQRDEVMDRYLRAGISPFLDRLGPDTYQKRVADVLHALKDVDIGRGLADTKPIRVQADEIIWYLYLCQQALDDPLCMDVSQVARAAPFFAGIGMRWGYAKSVLGLERKIDEVLSKYRSEPDGAIFEILVALAYAEHGWSVELLEEKPPNKTPDMRVTKGDLELFLECKRLMRRTSYAERERDDFLRLWDRATKVLIQQKQWLWFKGVFHVEVASLPDDFLADVISSVVPVGEGEFLAYDGPEATIHVRRIDRHAVQLHLAAWRVKTNSPMLNKLLGGDWAPPNSAVSIIKLAKVGHVADCETRVLGGYVEEIDWACGFTRDFDSPESLDKKAKDITKQLSNAVKQVPTDKPSVIHIAAETLEGRDVERLRTKKVMESMPKFLVDRPVLGVRFHRFQGNQTTDKLWEFDETVERYEMGAGLIEDLIPTTVVVSRDGEIRGGSHWELYP